MSSFRYFMMCGMLLWTTSAGSASAQYCTPPVHNPNYTGVVRVALYAQGQTAPMFEQTSTIADFYKHFSDNPATLVAGESYSLHVTTEHHLLNMGFTDRQNTRVWIDWNADGDFTDPGEEVGRWDSHVPGLVTAEVTVPVGATGPTRMRVYTDMPEPDGHDTPNPCGYLNSDNLIGQHGEVEDYSLAITTTSGVGGNTVAQDILSHPNPCTDRVAIPFALAVSGRVTVTVHDAQGREIARPHDGALPAGNHTVEWHPADMPSGVYYYRVETGEFRAAGSIIVRR